MDVCYFSKCEGVVLKGIEKNTRIFKSFKQIFIANSPKKGTKRSTDVRIS